VVPPKLIAYHRLYNLPTQVAPSPVVKINRAVIGRRIDRPSGRSAAKKRVLKLAGAVVDLSDLGTTIRCHQQAVAPGRLAPDTLKETTMKFFVYQPDPPAPDAPPPTSEMFVEMEKLIDEGTRAGVLIATGSFVGHPTRVNLGAGNYTVTDGPFVEAKELMGGYSLIEVKSLEEAIDWVKRGLDIVGAGTNQLCPVKSPDEFSAAASAGQ
jgi:hypothetical protein